MSADAQRKAYKYTCNMIRPQIYSERSLMESVVDFFSDVVPQAYTGAQKNEDKEKIQWVKFENCDCNDVSKNPDMFRSDTKGLPLLLILGYSNGIQIWHVTPNGEAQEVLSIRQGPVRLCRILPHPDQVLGHGDGYSTKRPLIVMCDSSSAGQPYCAVKFVSLKTGDEVHSISYGTLPVQEIECNKRFVVTVFLEKVCVYEACQFQQLFWITSCFPCPGPNVNPIALSTRWLAYADKRLVAMHQSCGGMSGDGSQSYAATVISAAKGAFKGLSMFGEAMVSSVTGSKPATPKRDYQQLDNGNRPGIVTVVDIQTIHNDHFNVNEDNEGDGLIAHFHAHANEPVSNMAFDPTGTLLVTACKLGHNFHVFRLMAHPVSSSLGAVHHLYTLHRGETTAKVIDISFNHDSRWITVSSHRGTTHLFPITPYGGPVNIRTHCKPHVVNRASRFHRSAGLDEFDHAVGRRSPVLSTSPGSSGQYDRYPTLIQQNTLNNNMGNPRLPPYPHPITIYPAYQVKQPLNVVLNPGNKNQSPSHVAARSDNVYSVCAKFCTPRLCVVGSPQLDMERRDGGKRAVDSLFVMAQSGTLVEYVLEPRAKSVSDKVTDDCMLELNVIGRMQWNLQRLKNSPELRPPLPSNSPLILAHEAVASQTPTAPDLYDLPGLTRQDSKDSLSSEHSSKDDGDGEQWLSQVEIITHAGPHRRLWMGPQFSFKTYQENTTVLSSNSSSLLSQSPESNLIAMDMMGDDTDLESLKLQPMRSNPVSMPNARPAYRRLSGDSSPLTVQGVGAQSVPLLIEAGSFEQSPHLIDVFSNWTESSVAKQPRGSDDVEEDRLKETLADAMVESPCKDLDKLSLRNQDNPRASVKSATKRKEHDGKETAGVKSAEKEKMEVNKEKSGVRKSKSGSKLKKLTQQEMENIDTETVVVSEKKDEASDVQNNSDSRKMKKQSKSKENIKESVKNIEVENIVEEISVLKVPENKKNKTIAENEIKKQDAVESISITETAYTTKEKDIVKPTTSEVNYPSSHAMKVNTAKNKSTITANKSNLDIDKSDTISTPVKTKTSDTATSKSSSNSKTDPDITANLELKSTVSTAEQSDRVRSKGRSSANQIDSGNTAKSQTANTSIKPDTNDVAKVSASKRASKQDTHENDSKSTDLASKNDEDTLMQPKSTSEEKQDTEKNLRKSPDKRDLGGHYASRNHNVNRTEEAEEEGSQAEVSLEVASAGCTTGAELDTPYTDKIADLNSAYDDKPWDHIEPQKDSCFADIKPESASQMVESVSQGKGKSKKKNGKKVKNIVEEKTKESPKKLPLAGESSHKIDNLALKPPKNNTTDTKNNSEKVIEPDETKQSTFAESQIEKGTESKEKNDLKKDGIVETGKGSLSIAETALEGGDCLNGFEQVINKKKEKPMIGKDTREDNRKVTRSIFTKQDDPEEAKYVEMKKKSDLFNNAVITIQPGANKSMSTRDENLQQQSKTLDQDTNNSDANMPEKVTDAVPLSPASSKENTELEMIEVKGKKKRKKKKNIMEDSMYQDTTKANEAADSGNGFSVEPPCQVDTEEDTNITVMKPEQEYGNDNTDEIVEILESLSVGTDSYNIENTIFVISDEEMKQEDIREIQTFEDESCSREVDLGNSTNVENSFKPERKNKKTLENEIVTEISTTVKAKDISAKESSVEPNEEFTVQKKKNRRKKKNENIEYDSSRSSSEREVSDSKVEQKRNEKESDKCIRYPELTKATKTPVVDDEIAVEDKNVKTNSQNPWMKDRNVTKKLFDKEEDLVDADIVMVADEDDGNDVVIIEEDTEEKTMDDSGESGSKYETAESDDPTAWERAEFVECMEESPSSSDTVTESKSRMSGKDMDDVLDEVSSFKTVISKKESKGNIAEIFIANVKDSSKNEKKVSPIEMRASVMQMSVYDESAGSSGRSSEEREATGAEKNSTQKSDKSKKKKRKSKK